MNCQQAQEYLSDYLEQSLDEPLKSSVESHLSSCAACSAETESLAFAIASVTNLPRLDPPIGFAQRVMAHVREIEQRPGLWARVGSALRRQMPLQATAVVLVAVLSLYLWKTEQGGNVPPAPEPAVTALRETPVAQAPRAKVEPSVSAETDRNKAPDTQATAPQKAPRTSSSPPRAAANVAKNTNSSVESESNTPLEPTFALPGRPIGPTIPVINSPSPPRIGTGPFSPLELDLESFRPARSSFARLADYELVMRRRQAQQDPAGAAANSEASRGNIDQLMATIPDATRAQTVWVSLAANQIEQFKRDLLTVGTIESESATSYRDLEFATKTGSEILIRLTVLPASESDRSSPTPRAIR